MKLHQDVPEAQHAQMRAQQGKEFVSSVFNELYQARLQCAADKVPWPADLDQAAAILAKHLGISPDVRRKIMGIKE